MYLNAAGEAALKCWLEIPEHYPNVKLDVSVITPNRIHRILIIEDNVNTNARAQDIVPLRGQTTEYKKLCEKNRTGLQAGSVLLFLLQRSAPFYCCETFSNRRGDARFFGGDRCRN